MNRWTGMCQLYDITHILVAMLETSWNWIMKPSTCVNFCTSATSGYHQRWRQQHSIILQNGFICNDRNCFVGHFAEHCAKISFRCFKLDKISSSILQDKLVVMRKGNIPSTAHVTKLVLISLCGELNGRVEVTVIFIIVNRPGKYEDER